MVLSAAAAMDGFGMSVCQCIRWSCRLGDQGSQKNKVTKSLTR
jgi:hypothetical protein